MNTMASQILGIFAVAIMAAAITYAGGHMARRMGRPWPRAVMPFTIAAAMVGFTIWNDYAWFPRLQAQLPDTVEVLGTGTGLKGMRPWTFVVPVTTRFTAMDRAEVGRRGETATGSVLLVERGQMTRLVRMEFDCAAGRQRPLTADGSAAAWSTAGEDDPAYRVACGGG
ncbi:hypothetical protein [uncultured Paracoccus sp.]|uniref:hypothetical protein n=1 Tax=uncultured Paracoccus sp. TaxID=189685 RepID=UPI002636BABA|nr:hypothetical protein [uncultured Paracoccus sp.]